MKDENEKSTKRKSVLIRIIAVMLIVGTIGVTYSFFSYTRTGGQNTVSVGRISFATNQTETVNLTNAFPITRTLAATDTTNTDDVVITVSGDTDYSGGIEYLVTATGVTNTVNSKTLPISIIVTPSGSLGTSNDNYYTARSSATASIYKQEAGNTLENDGRILVGYIAPNTTPGTASGINGTITIRAFLDSDLIAISDTYNNGNTPTDNMGTPASFGENKTVLTTTEWNSLQTNGVSFKVSIEAHEGIWVEKLPFRGTAAELASKAAYYGLENVADAYRYVGSNPDNYVIFNNEQWRILGVYENQLKIVRATYLAIKKAYNDDTTNNAWEGSDLETYLNQETEGGYYYSLTQSAKDMIVAGNWNAGVTSPLSNANEAYVAAIITPITRKVGLIAAYEYLYAAGESCREVAANMGSFTQTCGEQDWVKPSSAPIWTINPSSNGIKALLVAPPGNLYDLHVSYSEYSPSPAVYLNPGVTITGGTGEPGGNEYTLSYTAS